MSLSVSSILTLVVVLVGTWWIWDMWMKGQLGFGAIREEEEEGASAP